MALQNYKPCWDLYPREILWPQGASGYAHLSDLHHEVDFMCHSYLILYFLHWICSILT